MHLSGVHFTLDYIEYGDVAVLDIVSSLSRCGHHYVLGLSILIILITIVPSLERV